MQEQYRINPADIRAVISPSLGPCCAEFINWQQELSRAMQRHQVKKNHFDFWTISREQLIIAGVKENYIEVPKICTVCDQAFFSYRRAVQQNKYRGEPGITGRCGSLIMLS